MRAGLFRAWLILSFSSAAVQAQNPADAAAALAAERAAVRAVTDSALVRITRGDVAGLADLMLPEGRTFSARERDGAVVYRSSTREQQRVTPFSGKITERGFDQVEMVSGALAVAWVPYDLYIDGAWSHCGVDAFTMLKVAGRWQIATMAWSVVQPPACAKHPDGPPAR